MASSKLDHRIIKHAKKLHTQKRSPAYVSGAEYKHVRKVAKSGGIRKSEFTIEIKKYLNQFGNIGDKYDSNSIGYCAEAVSANRVITKACIRINQLSVGKVIRPKTMQLGKKCKMCKKLFK